MWKKYMPEGLTLILVTCMVMAAELLGEREIIFPEITALAVGYLVAGRQSWNVNGRRMILLITVCATAGVLIVRYMGLSPIKEVMIAFAIAQIVFMISGTTFAPFISAIVLPVMLQTTTWVYPLAALVLTVSIVLSRKALEKMGIREKEEFIPMKMSTTENAVEAGVRIGLIMAIAWIAYSCSCTYMIAPPLLVAFTEFSRKGNKARNMPVKTVFVLTSCAFIGAVCRMILQVQCRVPLTVAAFVATIGMLLVLHGSKLYLPPAGAITILAMLIPQEAILSFPMQILIGSSVLMATAKVVFMSRQVKNESEKKEELVK